MLIKRPEDVPSSEITDEKLYMDRRRFLVAAGGFGAAAAGSALAASLGRGVGDPRRWFSAQGAPIERGQQPEDKLNSYEEITSYNNYYEFGTQKEDPHENSGGFHAQPWTVRVEGLCNKPGDYHFEDLVKPHKVQDRVYRLRCVEAWSMVIPWQGIPLAEMINRFEPRPAAKYVAFTTV